MPRIPRLAGNLIAACLSTLVGLGVGEAALRLLRPVEYLKPPDPERYRHQEESLYRPSTVPGLSFEMVPDRDGTFEGMRVRTNRYGMRGGPPASHDDGRIYRIAALGDSYTFGFGVDESDTFVSVLQELLNRSSTDESRVYEVLNFGVVGYTTRDESVVLKRKALPFHPRGVILAYVLNDPEIDPRQSLHKYFDRIVWWRHSHFLRLIHLGWNNLQVRIYGEGDYLRYLHAPGREKWLSVEGAFESIRNDARESGAWVLVVIFPTVPKTPWREYRYPAIHAQVAEAARAKGFQVVDLLEVFRAHRPEDLIVSSSDDHPNPMAHRLAAEAIFNAIPMLSHRLAD